MATSTQALAGATGTRTAVPANTTSNWTAHTIAIRDAATAGLSVSLATTSASFAASLDSGDATATWSADATVEDTRLSNTAGWQLQVTSTTPTTGTRSLATDATRVTSVGGVACDGTGPCSLPTNSVSLPVTVPAGAVAPSAVRFANAASNTGEGRIDLTMTFTVSVPQNAFSGTYTSVVTISVVSGP